MFQSETYQSVDRYYRNVRNLEIYDQLPVYGKGPIITKSSILDVAAVQDPTLQKLLDIWWVLGVFYFSDAFMEVHLLKYMFLLTLKFFDSKIATKMTAFNFFFFWLLPKPKWHWFSRELFKNVPSRSESFIFRTDGN